MKQLHDVGVTNLGWVGAIQAVRFAIQLISIATLARLLMPSDYGLMAMAITFITAASIIRDAGVANALIQMERLPQDLLSSLFYFNVTVGLTLGIATVLLSHLVAVAFAEPRVQFVLMLLAVCFPLSSLSSIHQTLLERESRFRDVAKLEIYSSMCGFGVALIAAWNGLGVYSLVMQVLVTTALAVFLAWQRCSWRPSIEWSGAELRKLWRFSADLTGFNIANYFHRNLDNILIGRFLGAASLGLYNVAYTIMLLPLQILTFSINRALYPVYARQDRTKLAEYYLRMLTVLALIGAPMIFGLWSVRTMLVQVLLSAKWLPASAILTWLLPVAYIQCFASTTGPILMARGRTDIMRNLGFAFLPLWLVAFLAGLPYGAVGVAAAYFFATLLALLPTLYFTLREIDLKLDDLICAVWRPSLVGFIMALVVTIADIWFVPTTVHAFLRLAILCIMGAAVYLSLIRFVEPAFMSQIKAYLWQRS